MVLDSYRNSITWNLSYDRRVLYGIIILSLILYYARYVFLRYLGGNLQNYSSVFDNSFTNRKLLNF